MGRLPGHRPRGEHPGLRHRRHDACGSRGGVAPRRAWRLDDPRELGLGRIGRVVLGLAALPRHAVALRRPRAQVDHLASLAAERTPAILRSERRGLPTARAGNVLYRLQKVSSKATSQSAVRVRESSGCWEMKRILSTYLLALISGTHGMSGARRRRSI